VNHYQLLTGDDLVVAIDSVFTVVHDQTVLGCAVDDGVRTTFRLKKIGGLSLIDFSSVIES